MTQPLRAEHAPERLALYRAGLNHPLLTQRAGPGERPFIHPLLAPDGDGELTENEPAHHLWQHGLYVGLNAINGVGFWTEGRIAASASKDGAFHPQPLAPPTLEGNEARWRVVTDWQKPGGASLLTETQEWRFEDQADTLVLDLAWTLTATVDVVFGQYDYGGLFLRMPWRPDTRGAVLTSEDANTQEAAEGKRARWVALAMPLPNRLHGLAGVALLDHPSNPEHPVPWRVDNNLGIAPSRCIAGEWRLARGDATCSRYRVFANTGNINRDRVNAEWGRFAQT